MVLKIIGWPVPGIRSIPNPSKAVGAPPRAAGAPAFLPIVAKAPGPLAPAAWAAPAPEAVPMPDFAAAEREPTEVGDQDLEDAEEERVVNSG